MPNSKFAPLVVGLPRSGFSLLASVIIHFFKRMPNNKFDERCKVYRIFCDTFGQQFSEDIIKTIKLHSPDTTVLFNDNFRKMAGGPIWNQDEKGKKAYFRKYIGLGDKGDFTLITSYPLEVLDQYEIVHSHGPYKSWLNIPEFADYQRFASIRNPAGIINSACHSLNALASEYIQLLAPNINAEQARVDLAYYKLSDLKFFDALAMPLKEGLEELMKYADQYHIVAWEDVVTNPKETIYKLAEEIGFPLSQETCDQIWSQIGFRNLTGAHKHNYRVGKAYVGDENESLTNEHIQLLKDAGFDKYSNFFGYGDLQYLDPSKYTNFQKEVSEAIQAGKIIDPLKDRVLFDCAFNKSNIDFSGFGFRTYEWRDFTRIERSNIKDPTIELAVSESAEIIVKVLGHLFTSLSNVIHKKTSFNNFSSDVKNVAEYFPDVDINTSLNKIEAILSHH
ncbi:sulfotransferase domain-containing protein [Curvivirga sp.]|uniref:sulfotransferase domain-containing protein n=1 Tax=Curvivirga sp. TaxID=2856848 RepID=UPI003B5A3226